MVERLALGPCVNRFGSGTGETLSAASPANRRGSADETEVCYQISTPYAPAASRGYRYDDPAFAIPWPEPVTVISEKRPASAPRPS